MSRSSGIARFVQGGVVKTFRYATQLNMGLRDLVSRLLGPMKRPPLSPHEEAACDAFESAHPDRKLLRSRVIADEDTRWVVRLFYSGGRPTPYTIFTVSKPDNVAAEMSVAEARKSRYRIKNYR